MAEQEFRESLRISYDNVTATQLALPYHKTKRDSELRLFVEQATHELGSDDFLPHAVRVALAS